MAAPTSSRGVCLPLLVALCMIVGFPSLSASFVQAPPTIAGKQLPSRGLRAAPTRTSLSCLRASSSASSRPTVTLKIAIDTNWAVDDAALTAKRFTSPASLDAVHRLRRDSSAVLVGVGTVCRDDPGLTVRRVPLREGQEQPLRVVLDPSLRTPPQSALATDGLKTLLICCEGAGGDGRAGGLGEGVKIVQVPCLDSDKVAGGGKRRGLDLRAALDAMSERGVRELMVEGGPATARGFLDAGLVDRAIIIKAPTVEFDQQPVPSHISERTLTDAGLEELARHTLWDGDETTLWARQGVQWPSGQGEDYASWP